MGFIFVSVVCAILAALAAMLGALWFGSLCLFLWGRIKGSRGLVWLGGVPLALCSLVGIAGALSVVYLGLLLLWNLL